MDKQRIERYRRQLYSRVPLIGRWLRRRAAKALEAEALEAKVLEAEALEAEALEENGSPEVVNVMAEAVIRSGDEWVRGSALGGLLQLAGLNNAEAQEALCRLVVEHDHPLARETAVAEGYAPRDELQRALFCFLTGQWDKYEQLDFDGTYLKAAYETADDGLRRRLAEQARRAGRVAWVQVVVGGRQGRRLDEMTDEEWEATLATLGSSKRWKEMWRLAQAAPAVWSVRLLRRLGEAGWAPDEEENRTAFTQLVRLAEKYVEEAEGEPEGLVRCQSTLKGHTGNVECLVISPDGLLLSSGGKDDVVRLWQLPDGRPLATLEEHTNNIECLVISPDGRLLASGSGDNTVRLWQLPDGTPLRTLEGHTGDIKCLAISPDGQLLASGSNDATVRLWQLPGGAELGTLEGHTDWIECLIISPDGRLLASGSDDNTVRLWRLPNRIPLATLEGHTKWIKCLAVSTDGRLLASGSEDGTVRLWQLPGGAPLGTLDGHTGSIEYLAISSNGRLLASGSWDKTVRLWRLPGGEHLKTLKGHQGWVMCLAISPDGRFLASGGSSGLLESDCTVRLWRLPDGALLESLHGHISGIDSLAFSPDGRLLASGSWDDTVRLWGLQRLRLSILPITQLSLEDMARTEETLRDERTPDAERNRLAFTLALARWQRRFDVEIEETLPHIPMGEFDIEIGAWRG